MDFRAQVLCLMLFPSSGDGGCCPADLWRVSQAELSFPVVVALLGVIALPQGRQRVTLSWRVLSSRGADKFRKRMKSSRMRV